MKKRIILVLGIFLLLLVTYFSGPQISVPSYSLDLPLVPSDLNALEQYVQNREAAYPLREDNEARILWQDQSPQVTEYSLVYMHGFAGSYRDGYPLNVQIADSLGANIYLSRMPGHGLVSSAAMEGFTPESAWQSAREALVIGKTIGKKVILLSTSTGGTLALKLAQTYPESVHALINIAPNIEDEINSAFVLNSPWGHEIARAVVGERKQIRHLNEKAGQYWDTDYPSSALVELQVLVSTTMREETFAQISCPVITLYYYENIFQKDGHVDVDVYPDVHQLFSTPDSLKTLVQLSTPKTHFLGSDLMSEDIASVSREILGFLYGDLGIQRQEPDTLTVQEENVELRLAGGDPVQGESPLPQNLPK